MVLDFSFGLVGISFIDLSIIKVSTNMDFNQLHFTFI